MVDEPIILDDNTQEQLNVLTGDVLPVRQIQTVSSSGQLVIQRGGYFFNEADLPESLKPLLHGRGYIIDNDIITEDSGLSPKTYYIAADKVQGLIIPGRALSIGVEDNDIMYRWTDDGERWTNWRTLKDGSTDSYLPQLNNRFGEVQVYSTTGNAYVSLVSVR